MKQTKSQEVELTETLEDRVRRAVQEDIAIEPYSPEWPRLFLEEKEHLLTCLPRELIGRIEHFGSTAVPAQDCAHPGIAGIRLLLEADLGR